MESSTNKKLESSTKVYAIKLSLTTAGACCPKIVGGFCGVQDLKSISPNVPNEYIPISYRFTWESESEAQSWADEWVPQLFTGKKNVAEVLWGIEQVESDRIYHETPREEDGCLVIRGNKNRYRVWAVNGLYGNRG